MQPSLKIVAEYNYATTSRQREIINRLNQPQEDTRFYWHDDFRKTVHKYYYEWNQCDKKAKAHLHYLLHKAKTEKKRQKIKLAIESFNLFLENKPNMPKGAKVLDKNILHGKLNLNGQEIKVGLDVVFEYIKGNKKFIGAYVFASKKSKKHQFGTNEAKACSCLAYQYLKSLGMEYEVSHTYCKTLDIRSKVKEASPKSSEYLLRHLAFTAKTIALWTTSST